MRILWFSTILILLLCSFSQGQDVLTKRDTLNLHCITTLDYIEEHWDTVFAKIYHKTTLVATVGLVSDGRGTWTGTYLCSNLSYGSSWIKYFAVYDGDTTPVDASISILDTTSFIGSAAGLTAAEIADTIRGILSGEGLDTLDLYVFDEDTNAVEGVTITVYNFAKTAKAVRSKLTDVNGGAQVWLNPDDYQVLVACVGVTQTEWDTVSVVSGGSRDTIWVTSFDPGEPPSADLCRVYGWIYDLNDQPTSGMEVKASIDYSILRYGTKLISPYKKSTTTDANGYWYLDLYPSSILTPSTTKYDFYIYLSPGNTKHIQVTVPDSANWELTW
jgi:hypothetical protein